MASASGGASSSPSCWLPDGCWAGCGARVANTVPAATTSRTRAPRMASRFVRVMFPLQLKAASVCPGPCGVPCRVHPCTRPRGASAAAELLEPGLEPRQVLLEMLRTRLSDPVRSVIGDLGQLGPCGEELTVGRGRLEMHRGKRNVAHRLEEPGVLGVDVELVAVIRPRGDAAQHLSALRHPRPDVGDGVLGGPPLLEIARLVRDLRGDAIDEPMKSLPCLGLAGDGSGVG